MGLGKIFIILVIAYHLLGLYWAASIAGFLTISFVLLFVDDAVRKAKYKKLSEEGLKVLEDAQKDMKI